MRYLKESDADFAYWAINPRKLGNNDVEFYGLLDDDRRRRCMIIDYGTCPS